MTVSGSCTGEKVAFVLWAALLAGLAVGAVFSVYLASVPEEALVKQVDELGFERFASRVNAYTVAMLRRRLRFSAFALGSMFVVCGWSRKIVKKALATGFSGGRAARHEFVRELKDRIVKEDRLALGALIVVCLVGALVRISFMGQAVRYDEAYTFLRYATRPWYFGVSVYNAPNNHLLYTIVLHILNAFCGGSVYVIRGFAFVAGVMTIPATYVAVRRFLDAGPSLLVSAAVAGSSFLIEYSTDGRGYSFVVLCFLCLLALGGHAVISNNNFSWALFCVTAVLGFYTVPTMLFPYAAVATWLMFSGVELSGRELTRRSRVILCCTGVVGLLVGVLYLPVMVVSGPNALFANRFVSAVPWADVLRMLPGGLRYSWTLWNRDIPMPVEIVIVGGIVALGFSPAPSKHAVLKLLFSCLLACCGVMLIRPTVPPPRVWTFAVPLYYLAAFAVFNSRRNGKPLLPLSLFCASAVCLSLVMGGAVVLTRSILRSPETGTLRDAEKIALFFQGRLGPCDTVYATVPSDLPLEYYFWRHGLPQTAVNGTSSCPGSAFVVLNRTDGQTVEGVCPQGSPCSKRLGEWTPIQEYESASILLAKRFQ